MREVADGDMMYCSLQCIKEQLESMSLTHQMSTPLEWAIKYDLRPAIDAVSRAMKRARESVKKD